MTEYDSVKRGDDSCNVSLMGNVLEKGLFILTQKLIMNI